MVEEETEFRSAMPLSRPHSPLSSAAVVRVVLVATLAIAAAVLSGTAAQARPAHKRTIAGVSALLDRLSQQNEMLDEQYNVAVAAVTAKQKRAQAARRAAGAAAQASAEAGDRLSIASAQQYESGSVDSTGLLLTSADPQSYLDSLSTMDYLSARLATLASQSVASKAAARIAAQKAAALLMAAQATARGVAAERTSLAARTAHFEKVLASLTAEQRRRYALARSVAIAKAHAEAEAQARAQARADRAKRNAPRKAPVTAPAQPPRPAPVTSTAAVQRAIAYAEAQVGKAYSYGGTGPYSYDCSGLTMQSWAQGGVALPHSAAAQYNVGRHVSYAELQPGDLIFLYSPIGHVEIYVGNNLAVSAADPALGVVYVHPSQDMSSYVGATRPQG